MTMKIGELAKRTGLTASRIRFYERIGLLQGVKREPNGYRTYPPESIVILELITSAQAAGFSLDELRALLPANLVQQDHSSLVVELREKIKNIEKMQQQLAKSKAQLIRALTQIERQSENRADQSSGNSEGELTPKQLLNHFGSLSLEAVEPILDFRIEGNLQRR